MLARLSSLHIRSVETSLSQGLARAPSEKGGSGNGSPEHIAVLVAHKAGQARPSRPKSDPHHYADFHQYISETQILHECSSWIHAKGEIIARIGQVPSLRNKASTCLQLSWSKLASSTMYVHGGAIIPPKLSHLPRNLVQHIMKYIWATYSSTAKLMLESCVA